MLCNICISMDSGCFTLKILIAKRFRSGHPKCAHDEMMHVLALLRISKADILDSLPYLPVFG